MLLAGIGLATLDALHGHFTSAETQQEKYEQVRHLFRCGFDRELPAEEQLPVSVSTALEPLPTDDDSVALLQVLDASATVIKTDKVEPAHPARHLTRLEAVAWVSTARLDELQTAKTLRLECGGDCVVYLVTERQFECTTSAHNAWQYLCLSMRKATLVRLLQEAKELDHRLELAMCLGHEVVLGRTEKQVADNARFVERAHSRAVFVFDGMAQLDALVSPMREFADVQPFMKPGPPWTSLRVRDWKAEIGDRSLRQYLKPP